MSVCLSACLSFCLSVCMYAGMSVWMHIYMYVRNTKEQENECEETNLNFAYICLYLRQGIVSKFCF